MHIAIIGSGNIGATVARLAVDAGHEVALSNSRGPQSLAELVDELGPSARATSVEDAAEWGELVLVAAPFKVYNELPAEQLSGKIVVDAMNYYPQRDGSIAGAAENSSNLVAHALPGARLVKAFNTMYFQTLAHDGKPDAPAGERFVLFVAGDDVEAKQAVASLIEQFGFTAVDTGSLAEGGPRQQPDAPIYNKPMLPAQARELLGAS